MTPRFAGGGLSDPPRTPPPAPGRPDGRFAIGWLPPPPMVNLGGV